ncbi:MAG: TolC family protein [Deltaproteobacteria bacterium]|nr:TolC family protein [Deltaproteobacteria bacterium]
MRFPHFQKGLLLPLLIVLMSPTTLWALEPVDNGPAPVNRTSTETVKGSPWSGFNDPVLNDLVARALAGNPGIDAANARIQMAEAAAEASMAPLRPTVFADASYMLNNYVSPEKSMGISSFPVTNTDTPNFTQTATTRLVASYDADIAGRYRKARAATLKEVDASKEDAQAQGMTVALLVVQNYYDIAAAKIRVKLIESQIENNEKLLKLVMAQFDVGSASSLDVLQQRAQLESKKAQLPLAQTIIESGKLQLAALLDEPVENLPEIPARLPDLEHATVRINKTQLGDNLLKHQPSLRAARIRLDALSLKEVSARRALWPSLGLSGAVGYQWKRINDWINNETWQVGATLTVPIYMGGANRAGIQQAEAATLNAKYSLENSALQARTRVLAAQEREKAQREYLDALRAQNQSLELTVNEATRKYMAGLSSYLNVLTANDVLQLNELNLIQVERNLLAARIELLEALGGEWTQTLVTDKME